MAAVSMNVGGMVKVRQDVSDYIAPSQACVVTGAGKAGVEGGGGGDGGQQNEVRARPRRRKGERRDDDDEGKVSVTLADCLACSGCVTTAEAVLVGEQSGSVLDAQLRSNAEASTREQYRQIVVSVSPQSAASLAAAYGISSSRKAMRKLVGAFRLKGVQYVISTGPARALVEAELRNEFRAKLAKRHEDAGGCGPLLVSTCPGWVCYAEKKNGEQLVPHLSSTKSPQQAIGSLLKRGLGRRDIFHCAVMPCYDKKLEAAREDNRITEGSDDVKEVDLVLTTGEVAELLKDWGIDIGGCDEADFELPSDLPATIRSYFSSSSLSTRAGEGSGGYADAIYRSCVEDMFGIKLDNRLEWRQGRNPDIQELEVVDELDAVRLRFAKVYGFRNIQTLVRRIKRHDCHYDFVEVMACPGGCLNGGGQIKPTNELSTQEFLDKTELAFFAENQENGVLVGGCDTSNELYHSFENDTSCTGEKSGMLDKRGLLQTEFHARHQALAGEQVAINAFNGDW